ncbi:MAG: hypothetical protein HYV92_09535 [Candidatus Rokubacteria bacterium]|nr:hypothetical protein [Candidatus Rokubacteria bacterium]
MGGLALVLGLLTRYAALILALGPHRDFRGQSTLRLIFLMRRQEDGWPPHA